MRMRSAVAGLSRGKWPASWTSHRAAAIASFMAKKTEAARNSGGSPIACKRHCLTFKPSSGEGVTSKESFESLPLRIHRRSADKHFATTCILLYTQYDKIAHYSLLKSRRRAGSRHPWEGRRWTRSVCWRTPESCRFQVLAWTWRPSASTCAPRERTIRIPGWRCNICVYLYI